MKKILIIGKKSFLGSNLKTYLSKYYEVEQFSFEKVIKKSNNFFKKYCHIINTAIHPRYIKNTYNKRYDLDFRFLNKFKKINFYYIFLNSRKIYKQKFNITEKSKLYPIDNYSKNKLRTEKFIIKKFGKLIISLRISNIIGKRIFNNVRNNHKLFFDNFLIYQNKNKEYIFYNQFKDFLSIDQFCKIVFMIIKKNINGIYNVSLSRKIYISEIVKWLDKDLFKRIKFLKSTKGSFTLSNKKLLKKIKIKLTKIQLKTFCKKLNIN